MSTPAAARLARPRLAELVRQIGAHLPGVPAEVVDAGGGTGQVAVPLAEAGHRVTVVDPSAAMLATCADRAAESGPETSARLRTVQGDADRVAELLGPATADAVLCHGVLEVVADPAGTVAALAEVLRPGGVISLITTNRAELAMRAARRGDYREALRLLDDPVAGPARGAGRSGRERQPGPPHRAWTRAEVEPWFIAAGLEPVAVYGLRVFAEPPPDAGQAQLEAQAELEHLAGGREPFRSLAEYLHLVARLPA
jgi:SAM-dependent methyltransferase